MLRAIDRSLAVVSLVAAVLVVVLLFAGPSLIGAKKSGTAGYGGSSGIGSSGSSVGGVDRVGRSGVRERGLRLVPHAQGGRRDGLDRARPRSGPSIGIDRKRNRPIGRGRDAFIRRQAQLRADCSGRSVRLERRGTLAELGEDELVPFAALAV